MRALLPIPLLLFAACHHLPTLPEGTGRGVIAYDPAPPAGAKVWERPELRVGDRYVLLFGGKVRRSFQVVEAGPDGYTIELDGRSRLKRDKDLGNVSEYDIEHDVVTHVTSPVDTRFHWPLWIGKRWRSEFVERSPGDARPLEVAYEVEGLDTVVVPAGTFQALRILRTSRIKLAGDGSESYYDMATMFWYAPDIGLEIRQINNIFSYELVEWSRGPIEKAEKSDKPATPAEQPKAPTGGGSGG